MTRAIVALLALVALVAWAVLRRREPTASAVLPKWERLTDPGTNNSAEPDVTITSVMYGKWREPDDGIQTDDALWARARGEG